MMYIWIVLRHNISVMVSALINDRNKWMVQQMKKVKLTDDMKQ